MYTVYIIPQDKNKRSVFVEQHHTDNAFSTSGSWVILNPLEQSIKAKIEKIGVPLKDWDIKIYRGILTGCNEAFIITEQKRIAILDNCKTQEERQRTDDLIRPILRGRDIKRYGYNFAGLYLIAAHNGIPEKSIPRIDIDDYPAVKAHLDEYWDKISIRADQGDTPYNLRSCAYMDDLNKQKIVWGEISDRTKFALDEDGLFYNEATTFLLTGQHLVFLMCYLNSAVSEYLFSKIGTTTGVGTVRWKKFKIEQLQIPAYSSSVENQLNVMLKQYKNNVINEIAVERCVDTVFYRMCNFSTEEIAFIKEFKEAQSRG